MITKNVIFCPLLFESKHDEFFGTGVQSGQKASTIIPVNSKTVIIYDIMSVSYPMNWNSHNFKSIFSV